MVVAWELHERRANAEEMFIQRMEQARKAMELEKLHQEQQRKEEEDNDLEAGTTAAAAAAAGIVQKAELKEEAGDFDLEAGMTGGGGGGGGITKKTEKNPSRVSFHQQGSQNTHPRKGKNDYIFYAGLWFLWLMAGTVFYGYAKNSKLGLAKGFYMAVNVGYSIGWGYPKENFEDYLYFSSLYVIFGASLVAVALGFFADKIVEDADNWFVNLQQKEAYEKDNAPGQPIMVRLNALLVYRKETFRAVSLWLFWISCMILYSMRSVKWPFAEAQYFAISSLSTGGHWSIPEESDGWVYGVTGFFCALGVPIMGVAMGSLARLFVSKGDMDGIEDTLASEVTTEELSIMHKLGLEDGDGQIDKTEFIVLCMMRLGTDPNVVQYIVKRFHDLDDDKNGVLDLDEITRRRKNSNES